MGLSKLIIKSYFIPVSTQHRRRNVAPTRFRLVVTRKAARLHVHDDCLESHAFRPFAFNMAFRLHVPSIEQLAIPGVSILILFLAYTSQYLFYYIEPGPLTKIQALWLNGFVLGIWWCYDRACTVDPGPRGWVRRVGLSGDEDDGEDVILNKGKRWCRKCKAVKPPRAHHCKQCDRYGFH